MMAAVLAATCSTLRPIFVGYDFDVGAFLGQGIAQALAGRNEVAGRENEMVPISPAFRPASA